MPSGPSKPLLICHFIGVRESGANLTTVLFPILLTYSEPSLSTVRPPGWSIAFVIVWNGSLCPDRYSTTLFWYRFAT